MLQINFLNVEIGVFLRYLRCFSQIECVQINKKTMELMQEAIVNMRDLSQRAQIIENSTRNDVDFLFDLNEHQYELQRHILCRSCYVSWQMVLLLNKNNNVCTKLKFHTKQFHHQYFDNTFAVLISFFQGSVSIIKRWFYSTFKLKTSRRPFQWIEFIFIGFFPRKWLNDFTSKWSQHSYITRCKYTLENSLFLEKFGNFSSYRCYFIIFVDELFPVFYLVVG